MSRHRWFAGLLTLLVSPSSIWAVAGYQPAFPAEEYAERRARFFEQVEDGVSIFLGAEARADYTRFRQNNSFLYFTGIEAPGAVLLLDGTSKRSTLYVPQQSPRDLRAEGPQLQPGDDAVAATGLDAIHHVHELTGQLLGQLVFRQLRGVPPKVYVSAFPEELPALDSAAGALLAAQHPWDGRLSREARLVRWLRDRVPLVEVASHDAVVHALRRVKTAREIETMRASARLSAAAVDEAIRATRPGRFEYEVSAVAEFVMKRGGAERLAWDNIVASGANGNIWHYAANRSEMQAGDLVLADIGAEYRYYATDITRTWPVSGRFTEEQKTMYECVLEASNATIAAVAPGVTGGELAEVAREVFERHGFGDYALRGVGHLVGLSAHDVGGSREPFVPGVVFNVEPILDIPEKQVHIRLEDSVLVTEAGHEVLTADSPKDIESLYRLYDEGSRLLGGSP